MLVYLISKGVRQRLTQRPVFMPVLLKFMLVKMLNVNTQQFKIRDSADVGNAYELGKPIHYYKRTCDVAHDYEELSKEIINRIEKKAN